MGSAGNQCFDLLQAFARALNHELRTPLAVVSNDLHFFASRDPSGVGASALAQCQRLSAVLRRAAVLGSEPLVMRPLTTSELAAALGVVPRPSDEITVCADPQRLKLLATLLEELTGHPLSGGSLTTADTTVTIRFERTTALAVDSLERVLAETIVAAFGGTLTTTDPSHTIVIELPRHYP